MVSPFLIALLIALTPLAYASPLDPSWVCGIYDGDDFDDVVALLMSGTGVVDPFSLSGIGLQRMAVEAMPGIDEDALPVVTSSSNPTRGPPAL